MISWGLATKINLFLLVKFSWKICIQFSNWELHWLLNEHRTYLLWSVVVGLSRLSAKLETLAAPRSWKNGRASWFLLTTWLAHTPIEPYRSWKDRPQGPKLTSFATILQQMTTKEVPYSEECQCRLYSVVGYNLCLSFSAATFTGPWEKTRDHPVMPEGQCLAKYRISFGWP